MKNIFLLPTDNPSKLYYSNHWTKPYLQNKERQKEEFINIQYIYITNDEVVKIDDYYYNFRTNSVQKRSEGTDDKSYKEELKVILTNNPKLKTVQQLTEEQLLDFVNNACEFVEVDEVYKSTVYDQPDKFSHYSVSFAPKKEQKQQEVVIEETLEEAIDREYKDAANNAYFGNGFKRGAKWQSERRS